MSSLVVSLPHAAASAGAARRSVRAYLSALPEAELYTVVLATSEVVANAVLHGEGPVTVHVRPGLGVVHVEVTDAGRAGPRIHRVHGDEEESGRGLHMVEMLASDWGVAPARRGAGKTIWFDIDTTLS